jgi:hypothetical protein
VAARGWLASARQQGISVAYNSRGRLRIIYPRRMAAEERTKFELAFRWFDAEIRELLRGVADEEGNALSDDSEL